MKKVVLIILMMLIVSLAAVPATAKTVFDLPVTYTQSQFKDLSTDLGLAVSYLPLAPAEPLGGKVLPGFDIGIEGTSVNIDRDKSYWSDATADLPSSIIFPKLHAQIGLPVVPIDFGFVYAQVPDSEIKYWGAEVKWAILRGSTVSPAVALRGAYTKLEGIDEIELDTKSIDISISKGFAIFTPYAGIGAVWISSKENDPSVNLNKEDITETKGFVGMKVSMGLINIVGEADFAKVNLYSLRLNLHF